MMSDYRDDYPKEAIGGGNPYYCCSFCGVSDPEINGLLSKHTESCEWRRSQESKLKHAKKSDFVYLDDVYNVLIGLGYLRGIDPIATIKPTHGSCCTCQECGYYHDECVCDHNELLFELAKVIMD